MRGASSVSASFRPRKRLGQSFLVTPKTADRLVDALELTAEDNVLEIGPGRGILTSRLAQRTHKVWAVEIDSYLAEALRAQAPPNVCVVEKDILEFELGPHAPLKVLGNLPYSQTTAILLYLLKNRAYWTCAVLTLQREYALRLAARQNTKQYGSITVLTQLLCSVERLFYIHPSQFKPRPRVVSTSLRLVPRTDAEVGLTDLAFFQKVVRAGFGQRRKTLANALAVLGFEAGRLERCARRAGIDLRRRAETMSVEEFRRLTDELAAAS